MCLWGLFQTGGSEDVGQLLGDWWSESGRGGEAPWAPGGAGLQEELGSRRSWAPGGAGLRKMTTLSQHVLQG